MEFSTIGSEDSLDEAKVRLESVEALIVWGEDSILGVLTSNHLGRSGNCGEACELDILIDPVSNESKIRQPRFIVTTDNGEPVSLIHGP